MTMRVVHAPDGYDELLAPLPDGARIASRGKAGIAVRTVSDVWSGLELVVRRELRR
jgi:hypothetical protein